MQLYKFRANGCYSLSNIAPIFPEISEPSDLMHILDTLQLCAPMDSQSDDTVEIPLFILGQPPSDVWNKDKPSYVYGGRAIFWKDRSKIT